MPFQKGNKLGLKHGDTVNGKPTYPYVAWCHMFRRCYYPSHPSFKYYGGRGIQICARWHKSNPNGFLNFKSDMGERPSVSHSLDRIDNDGHYMPSNCRWATRRQQTENKRQQRGEKAGGAILSNEDVFLIKSLHLSGFTGREIHRRVGKCSYSNIKNILQGKAWNHIHGRSLSSLRANRTRKEQHV